MGKIPALLSGSRDFCCRYLWGRPYKFPFVRACHKLVLSEGNHFHLSAVYQECSNQIANRRLVMSVLVFWAELNIEKNRFC